jgi:hypothetical protein
MMGKTTWPPLRHFTAAARLTPKFATTNNSDTRPETHPAATIATTSDAARQTPRRVMLAQSMLAARIAPKAAAFHAND